jgi:RNA polymerase sigma-70 factor (ECF subfamily)
MCGRRSLPTGFNRSSSQFAQHRWVARADRHKGRFRSFLLMAMKRFLANEWDKVKTLKRGGRAQLVPLPLDAAETRYTQEPVTMSTPEQVFEKRWPAR